MTTWSKIDKAIRPPHCVLREELLDPHIVTAHNVVGKIISNVFRCAEKGMDAVAFADHKVWGKGEHTT